MQNKRNKLLLGIITLFFLILVIFLIVWLKPDNSNNENTSTVNQSEHTDASSQPLNANQQDAQSLSFASKSQQDIQINCQIAMDSSNRLIVNENTKNCFEFFITQYGEKTIDQIKIDFVSYSKASYKEPLLSQITDLWSRYMEYRQSLGDLQAPNIDKEDPKYYKAIFTDMKNLRKKFFSNYEIEGLFGIEDVYNDYTIDRMEVMNDKKLTAEQKAQKLKELFNDLPEDWKANLQQISQLEDLRKLTSDIKARGGSAEEIRQMRTTLVGPEATQRLEKLDTQRTDWKNRVNNYLNERESIVKSNMSDSAKQAAIQKLRDQNFTNSHEQLRLQTFETVHDQGGKLPFSD